MSSPESESAHPALDRRALLTGALQLGTASVGALALAGCEATGAPLPADSEEPEVTLPSGNFRVDVHCHHIPDFYRLSLATHGVLTAGGIPIPAWSPSLAVEFMNRYGIQTQVVSISEPGVAYLSTAEERLAMAMQLNDYTTQELINSSTSLLAGRFGGFAVLPLGDLNDPADIVNACNEARRAIQVLGMDGVGIFSNYQGVYLGDPRLLPLMQVLNELEAMVFLHPVTPVKPAAITLPSFLFEFTFDTTRAAVNMLYNGTYRKFPRIRWLLAHAGGTLPFLAYRTSLLTLSPALADNLGLEILDQVELFGSYRKLYYDTALSPAPSAMKSVREVTSLDHILFATDWPFSNLAFLLSVDGDPQPRLSETFTNAERILVERDNALDQFPRIAAMQGRN